VNKELSSKLESGSGATVSVLVPGYGEVSEGASFVGNESDLDVLVDKVPVTVGLKKIGAQYDLLEKSVKLNTFESQIAQPYSAKLAASVNKDVFTTVLGSAHSSIVSQTSFNDLAEAVAYVETSRVGDSIAGMLSPISKATIIGTGANKFANDKLGEGLYRGEIGEFSGAEFFASPDAGALKIGQTAAQAFAFTATVGAITDGATSLSLTSITPASGNTITVIPAGTPIILGTGTAGTPGSISSSVTVSDVFGNDTGVMRTFVVARDTPVSGGAASVPIAPVNLVGGSAAVPNTYYDGAGTAIPSGSVLCPLFVGTKYYLGAVFASKCIAFASATPKPFGGNADSKASELDGEMGCRISVIPAGLEGVDRFRIDIMYGASPLYGAGAVALYTQAI
jgi:hypothetical protein